MFIVIIFKVLRHGSKNDTKMTKAKKIRRKAISAIVLLDMFGVGWIFGILGGVTNIQLISLPFQVLFIIIVAFHGVLVFLFHPFRSKDAHEEWKKWLYYITCRKEAYHIQLNKSKRRSAPRVSEQSTTQPRSNRTLSTSTSGTGARFEYRRDSDSSSSTLAFRLSTMDHYPMAEKSSLHPIAEESASISDVFTEEIKIHATRPDIHVFNKDDVLLTIGNETALSNWQDSAMDNSDLPQSTSLVVLKNTSNDNGSSLGQDLHNEDEECVVYCNFEDYNTEL